jgi:hypothetical protein
LRAVDLFEAPNEAHYVGPCIATSARMASELFKPTLGNQDSLYSMPMPMPADQLNIDPYFHLN